MLERILNRISPSSLAFIAIALVIAGYAIYQLRAVATGPRISVISPSDGTVFSDPLVGITGETKNIAHITLNDFPVFVDAEGVFKEQLLLSMGYNIIEINGKDRFGRETTKILRLVLK